MSLSLDKIFPLGSFLSMLPEVDILERGEKWEETPKRGSVLEWTTLISHQPAHLNLALIFKQSEFTRHSLSINHRKQTKWAIIGVQCDGVLWEIQGAFLFILLGHDLSLHEPLLFCAWAFSRNENERSPHTLWIPGVCEVGLGTSASPPCKGFLAREGTLNLLYSDPGILKPTERFTG